MYKSLTNNLTFIPSSFKYPTRNGSYPFSMIHLSRFNLNHLHRRRKIINNPNNSLLQIITYPVSLARPPSMAEVERAQNPTEESEKKPLPKELPTPPEKPEAGDCCGSGCVRCVWDVYYDELDAYNRVLDKFNSQSQSQSQSPSNS